MSIPDLPAVKFLIIVIVAQLTGAGHIDLPITMHGVLMQLTLTPPAVLGQPQRLLQALLASTTIADVIVDINNFETINKRTFSRCIRGATGVESAPALPDGGSGTWADSGQITHIDAMTSANNFAAGSRIIVFGCD
jgi:hypothetical protein